MSETDALREELARLEQYGHPRAEQVRKALAAADKAAAGAKRAAAKPEDDAEPVQEKAVPSAPVERATRKG